MNTRCRPGRHIAVGRRAPPARSRSSATMHSSQGGEKTMWRKRRWTRRCEDRLYLLRPRAGHATAARDHAAQPAGCRAKAAQPFVQLTLFRNVFLYGSRIHFQEKFRLDGNQSISLFAKHAEPSDAGHNERERLDAAGCRCSLRTNWTQADGPDAVHSC